MSQVPGRRGQMCPAQPDSGPGAVLVGTRGSSLGHTHSLLAITPKVDTQDNSQDDTPKITREHLRACSVHKGP